MLQRAASNAYSWWWASHIRTRQSKWLDSNLQEMEDIVKKMLKLIEADADSFARRAELYFKRRPELISFVENAYRAYRALAERYDHISGELHNANHTIATACPDQVQYAMLEEDEDNIPKALTPIDPSKINKPLVEGLMKRRENESSIKQKQHKSGVPQINKEEAREEINKLQKEILVMQTEKEFIKSSYESGIAKYWEIEKQIMEMQDKVCCLQDEFGTGAVIEDEEARSLMTERALKSCEDAIVGVQEKRKKTMEQAKLESERLKTANEKLMTLKGEYCQSDNEKAEASVMSTQMSITAEKMEEDENSLNEARLELQSICEKIKTHFEMNPESSVIEVAEKVNELVNKVIMLEFTVSSQAIQINRLTSENNELDKSLRKLEEEKSTLINDSNASSKRLKEAEEKLSEVQAIEKIVQDEEINVLENFAETYRSLSGLSDKLQSPQTSEHDSTTDASTREQTSTFNNEWKIVSQDEVEFHTTAELSDSQQDSQQDASQVLAGSQFHSAPEKSETKNRNELGDGAASADSTIHQTNNEVILHAENDHTLSFQQSGLEEKENIPLAEYTSILQNYEETKRKLSETEHKNEEYLQETMVLVGELKSAIAVKDEEISLLRQQLAALKTSSNVAIHASSVKDCCHGEQKPVSTSTSAMLTVSFEHQESETPKDLNISTTTKRQQNVVFTDKQSSLAEDNNLDHINEPESISPIAEKFRKDIDALLDGNLEFWLRFSTSFHHIQEFKVKYEDMQTDISKLEDKKSAEANETTNYDEARKSESARITARLRELKTEVQVWLEQSALLGSELQSRISSLCELQEEITSGTNTKSKSADGLFTPYHAAKFHGEVMNMKQENNKAASELQIGQKQVKKLQDEIELQLSKLCEKFEPFASERSPDAHLEHSPSRTRVPLRVFLFGAKPKKLSFFQRIQPVLQKQSKFKAGHQSKRFSQPEE